MFWGGLCKMSLCVHTLLIQWTVDTWAYAGVSESSQTTSTDRQPMALHECMRYDWELATSPLSVPSGFAVWTSGVAQHECLSPHVPSHLRFQHGRETGAASQHQILRQTQQIWRLLKCYDVRMEMRPCVVRRVSSGTCASRGAEHHSKKTRGQGDLPRAQPRKMWKQFGGLCMRIVGEQLTF